MNNENLPQFEHDLAQADTPEELGNEQVDTNNPAESLNQGLIRLYYKYLSQIDRQHEKGLIDRKKADELARKVLNLAENDGLGNEIGYTPTEKAREIMGPDSFFGREEVKKAFGIEITEHIPTIPFSQGELERAKELGQFLVLRVNQTADGQPLTMEKIEQILQPKFDSENKGKVLYPNDWYKTESFFTSQTPNIGWALTTRRTIPNSLGKNYLEQTEVLVDYLKHQVFAGGTIPPKFERAIAQFKASKDEIEQLMENGSWLAASQKLSRLEINQLTRQSQVEVLYDELIYYQNTNKRILESEFTWTNTWDSHGYLICVGSSDFQDVDEGVDIDWRVSLATDVYLGVSFSRRGADLKL